ncbi:FAD-dependent oxidoreductase [Streptomyces sp. HUAS MG47]|uniref:NAD(P)/FAD-dependent oxidoreductase n=1 Tax=Streptomyces solicamelliae TaxID=3231716 RepID=UPI003877D1DF
MRTVTVVGASLAGLYAARALRAQGYDGRLVIVGEEPHRPYDRPPLSKGFLTGATGEPDLALADAEEETALDAEWLLGVRARGLDARGRTLLLGDGRSVATDGLVVATGARARPLPGAEGLAGVHLLRTLDDARALRDALGGPARRVVVIGAGFIGAETASSCATLGHDVTVVETARLPLLPQLGPEMGEFCAGLHARRGVRLLTGVRVAALRGRAAVASPRITAVELADGRVLPADVVLTGIGAVPNDGWLAGSPLAVADGVVCDDGCATALPQVVAVGDVARVGGVRSEHWTGATEQPAVAVRNLLAGRTVAHVRRAPYFWSDQYGVRLQFAGRRHDGDTARVVEGSPDEASFLCHYEHAGVTTAVLAVDRPRAFQRARRDLGRAGATPTGQQRGRSARPGSSALSTSRPATSL